MARLHFGISDQSKASIHRLADAKALAAAGRWRGAMYLAGYSVECLLKKKLLEKFRCRTLFDLQDELHSRVTLALDATIFTHHLESLFALAGGLQRVRENRESWDQFRIVNEWVPAWRYSPDMSNVEDADEFLSAVDRVLHWIHANL
ncbi:MAG: hypothetical protein WD872_15490 [Pirellulaceae bacterium]